MILALATTLATLWLLVLGSGVRFPALGPAAALCRDVACTRMGRLGLAWVLGILCMNVWETSVDPEIGPALDLDFTPVVHRIEGNLVVDLQDFLAGWGLASFWVWVYVFLYPALLLAPVLVFHARGDGRAIRAYLGAFSLNYLVAVPFYLFVPVMETGVSRLTQAQPVLDYIWPQFLALLRSSSAPDNCFPSLHASLSLTVALVALRHGPARLAALSALSAVLIVLSTWALGIHWVLDAAAGAVLAGAAVALGPRLVDSVLALAERSAGARRAFSSG